MNIALVGYGKMGKEVEKTAQERGHEIVLAIDIDNQHEFTPGNLGKADVAIEFTRPDTAVSNISKCLKAKLPVVCGTTGWMEHLPAVSGLVNENQTALFHAPNYSLGVNIFFKLNEYLARIMNNFEQYNAEIEETHHTQKLDSPSGTAIKLAEGLLANLDRKSEWEEDTADKASKLNIHAIRKENVFGIHTITYDSDVDTISMAHEAKSRKGFALGAVVAAEFIKDKKGVFTMNDLLKF